MSRNVVNVILGGQPITVEVLHVEKVQRKTQTDVTLHYIIPKEIRHHQRRSIVKKVFPIFSNSTKKHMGIGFSVTFFNHSLKNRCISSMNIGWKTEKRKEDGGRAESLWNILKRDKE